MNPGEVLIWMSNNMEVWVPHARMVFSTIAVGCLYLFVLSFHD